jgi:endonuclease G, mitochondrial
MPMLTNSQMAAYRHRLAARSAPTPGLESFEAAEAPLSPDDIEDRVEQSRETLLKLLEDYFGADPGREALVDRLLREGGEGLRMLADDDGDALGANPAAQAGLEAIVRTDGSRPSFLVKDGDIDLKSSPVGSWGARLTGRMAALRTAVAAVGRIDTPGVGGGYQGTGFLVGPDVVLTNRHVLQLIAEEGAGGAWQLRPDVAIDFGHEFKARETVNRRRVKSVLFWGAKAINFSAIDHAKLDLALLELEPQTGDGPKPFAVQSAPPDQTGPGLTMVTIGYPGPPPFSWYSVTLLDQLFQKSFGYKRLAPGETIASAASQSQWTLAHDATTLGGNSGSVVLALDGDHAALGLHYGGQPAGPAENWSHRLDLVLGQTTGGAPATLTQVLEKYGARLTSAPSSSPPPPPVPVTQPTPASPRPPAPTTTRPATVASPGRVPSGVGRPPAGGTITLAGMRRLGDRAAAEAPGDGETPASAFAGRRGYDPNFIPGFRIPLPLARGNRRADMRRLRTGTGVELKYEHFSVIMSVSRRMPMLTACNIDGAESRSLPRLTQWNYDGRLRREDQWGNELYQGRDNPLDRGHMVRREDPVWGPLAVARRGNADTFHYTNSCPQMGTVNQQVWLGLENYVLRHTREDDMRVSVFTGPFFTDDDVSYRGGLIPRSFWKVVAFVLDDGRPSATAYRVRQDRELQALEFVFGAYKTFQISIRQVADETGLDFSALIPFDGFSQHEAATGVVLAERLDTFDQIRV